MKNLNYFPFERNRYYYGKLLREADFNQEQSYMNNKRRFINRFLHGVGVAAGLRVVAVDEKSVSIEAGAALDFSGREIIVDTPAVCRLSQLDGFSGTQDGGKDYVYLCMEYEETGASPSYNIAGRTSAGEEEGDCDRMKEGYHLYLTTEELDVFYQRPESLYRKQEVLFYQDGISVSQTMPSLLNGGGEFLVTLRITNLGAARKVSLKVEEELSCAFFGEERMLLAEIGETLLERGETVEKTLSLRAMALEQGEAALSLKPEKLSLSIGSRRFRSRDERTMEAPILSEDLWEAAKRRQTDMAMDTILKHNYPQGICLARIYLVKTSGVYMIDRVESNPFGQYAASAMELAGSVEWLHEQLKELKKEAESGREKPVGKEAATGGIPGAPMAQGLVTLDLGIGGKRGQRYFSGDIFHGLGLGDVDVRLSVCQDALRYIGSGEVFEEMKVKAELAARVNCENGSFVIGARLLEPSTERTLTIRWQASLIQTETEAGSAEPRLYIRPNLLQLKVRESFYLETEAVNMMNPAVSWSVKTKEGGTITQDGLYTAPSVPGVYEIHAASEENPAVGATLFVIVR